MKLTARNVHAVLPEAINRIQTYGVEEESRNGPVLVLPMPVDTLYTHPEERVLFWPQRDANPFFHFFEGLWMIQGRSDVAFLTQFAKQIGAYSDDGATLHGAYGYRWRCKFADDQLEWAIERLKKDPNDRRVVITMWDPSSDMAQADKGGKDVPCNTQIYLCIKKTQEGPKLCMKVNCRSNDILWGAYGANAVHMSMLQEYLALNIGVGVGWYIQASFNWHVYKDFLEKMLARPKPRSDQDDLSHHCLQQLATFPNPYELATAERTLVRPFKMIERPERWKQELCGFFEISDGLGFKEPFEEPFFRDVVVPLFSAHYAYKLGDYENAFAELRGCTAIDWQIAAWEWLKRREAQQEAKSG